MAIKTGFESLDNRIFRNEHLDNYYKDWHYLGVINGNDAYYRKSRNGSINLSLVYGFNGWEYASPEYTNQIDRLEFYIKNNRNTYELILRTIKAIGDSVKLPNDLEDKAYRHRRVHEYKIKKESEWIREKFFKKFKC